LGGGEAEETEEREEEKEKNERMKEKPYRLGRLLRIRRDPLTLGERLPQRSPVRGLIRVVVLAKQWLHSVRCFLGMIVWDSAAEKEKKS